MPRRPGPSLSRTQRTTPNVDRKEGEQPELTADEQKIQAMVENGRRRLGDGYRGGYNGPQPVGSPVSCSDLIDSMRDAVGLRPWCSPGGTLTAMNKVQNLHDPGFGGPWQSGQDYPAGTIFVATSGQGGPDGTHMSMAIGGGQAIESIAPGGPRIAGGIGSFPDRSQVWTGVMSDVGSAALSPLESATQEGGILDNLTEGIANGILRAILTVAGFAYGFLVLRLLDFWGGFWWEIWKKVLGELAPWLEEVDLIKIATGQETDVPELPPVTGSEGIALDDEALNRLFFVLFVFFSYQLAWGRDAQGNYRLDNALGGLGQLSNVDLKSRRAKNTRATLEAEVVTELMAERGVPERAARAVAQKELKKQSDAELRKSAQAIIARLRAERMPRELGTAKFKVIKGGAERPPARATLEAEAIEELVKQGVPRERAERTVRRGNVREVRASGNT